jgi:hypothetical protein
MVYYHTKKRNLGKFLEGLAMEGVGILYGNFGLFYVHLVYCVIIWYIVPINIWQP